ncbi:hypothetical protein [Nocardia sp. NPDC057440]|uniref:hypothetical protein n=1 Tax=Nocardia sp. NPDC057440 TaxID=3346134 RepID=UPI00366BE625
MGFWGSLATGIAGVAGYAIGGPAGAALLGGVVGGIAAAIESGGDWGEIGKGMAYGAVGGLLGGGIGGLGVRTAFQASGRTAISLSSAGLKSAVRGRMPTAWIEAQLPMTLIGRSTPWRGLMGAGFGAAKIETLVTAPQWIPDMIDRYWGDHTPPPLGTIPLIDISPPDIPAELSHVMMPNPAALPDGLVLSLVPETHYRGLPPIYITTWLSFGNGPYTPPPEKLAVPAVAGASMANMPSYVARVDGLRSIYDSIREADIAVASVLKKTAEDCAAGKADIDKLVKGVNEMAGTHPHDVKAIGKYSEAGVLDGTKFATEADFNEDNFVLSVVESVMNTLNVAMNGTDKGPGWAAKFEAFAAAIDGKKPEAATPTDGGKVTDVKVTDDKVTDDKVTDDKVTDRTGPTGYTPYAGTNPVGTGISTSPVSAAVDGPPKSWEWDTGPASKPGSSTTNDDSPSRATDQPAAKAGSQSPDVSPDASSEMPTVPSVPATLPTPAATGMQNLLPFLMNNNTTGNRRSAEDDSAAEGGGHDTAKTGAVPGSAPAAANQPASSTQQQPATPSAAAQAASPARASATPISGLAAQVQAPSEEDSLIYTFPDGRTQRVSRVVAHALDAAFGNAAGTDARQAYAKTSAAVPADKDLGEPVDPYQLMTGDVALWREKIPGDVEAWRETAALVVAFGSDVNTSFEMIVDGELRPFAAEASGKQGAFGPFAGFLHPAGIEIPVAAPDAAVPTSTAPADSSAGASIVVPA